MGLSGRLKLLQRSTAHLFREGQRPMHWICSASGRHILPCRSAISLGAGSIIAEVPETKSIVHRVMLPPDVEGEVIRVKEDGGYTIGEELVVIRTPKGEEHSLTMMQKWPIRIPRPVASRYPADRPLVTGTAYPRHAVPDCKRRNSGASGRIWNRKNHDPAPACQVV